MKKPVIESQHTPKVEKPAGAISSEEFRQRLLRAVSPPAFTVDSEKIITGINEAFTHVLGYTVSEIVGQPCSVLKGDCCDDVCHLYGEGSKGVVVGRQSHFIAKDGGRRTVIKDAKVIGAQSGASAYGVEFLVDVTELANGSLAAEVTGSLLKKANEQLENTISFAKEMALRVRMSDATKSSFLDYLSHEVRTPLNSIIGFSQLLSFDESLTDEQRGYVETIQKSGDALLNMITDIIDFSKIETERLDLENIPFDLASTVEEVVESLKFSARERGLNLGYFISPEVVKDLRGDPIRLRQLLLNLVGEAVKYTERGEITIRVSQQKLRKKRSLVRFEIQDTGMGFLQADQLEIFDSTGGGDSTANRKYSNAGLGLAISQRLVNKMGGKINFTGRADGGGTFYFSLPFGLTIEDRTGLMNSTDQMEFSLGGAKAIEERASGRSRGWGSGYKVLLADDNAVNRKLVTSMLEKRGCIVTTADNGEEAIFHVFTNRAGGGFDFTLMDVQMPKMDGLEATAVIREKEAKFDTHLPIIAMTSRALKGDKKRCLAAGMDAYISKPIMVNKLYKLIEEVMSSRFRKYGSEGSGDNARGGSVAESEVMDYDEALKRVDGDENLLFEAARIFMDESGKMMEAIAEAVRREDAEALELAAHSLKGAVGNFGARAAFEAAQKLEALGRDRDLSSAEETLAVLRREIELLLEVFQRLYESMEVR